MKKHRKEAILLSFLKEKEKYKRLAEFIVDLIQDDPSAPEESLHTVIYRIKDESRLIEKIDMLNSRVASDKEIITEKNYQAAIPDLLGVRIICLRLSDVGKIEGYLNLLAKEKIIRFIKGPEQKNTFVLPLDLGELIPEGTDLRYTGYSSIHYRMQVGENAGAPPDLVNLQFELQLRTILEEAWSEIDHKYRYMRSRSGIQLPEHIHTGFYNLSAFLQVAALQAEYLCSSAEAFNRVRTPASEDKQPARRGDAPAAPSLAGEELAGIDAASTIAADLQEILGVEVTPRTIMYIDKRLGELKVEETEGKSLQQLFGKRRLAEFRAVFQEIFTAKPFASASNLSIDVINALNFAIACELEGKRVAREGLRVVLRWRKDRQRR
ncbi:RelA/SpoT domain-containing protein [Desulfoprunum benzoelyticum]|uniref:PpGpp synthetase/RelA/SpoT-type nucleotidyltransferase n=1 Tax=Desulfoprunum benzoelyticum TaxID=1506996 RepID=A0A840US30_9BACT|nr:RelA/SpoT domain-containing protein [Desulfoprunum benzoelyticum]MBB5349027.1 ppGpp synthetase/RelA/SpoT-type nucleotidyltransferase [Desulfoprunum benzoelyticum]MBM9530520.1 RelA/SpoT domain-containing protein [Desulfoprunum benzoelyticum]